jgi:hypothetical protein
MSFNCAGCGRDCGQFVCCQSCWTRVPAEIRWAPAAWVGKKQIDAATAVRNWLTEHPAAPTDIPPSSPPLLILKERGYGCNCSRQSGGATPYGVRVGTEMNLRYQHGHGCWWLTPDQADELADQLKTCAEWARQGPPPKIDPHVKVPDLQIRPDGLLQTAYGPINPDEWGN